MGDAEWGSELAAQVALAVAQRCLSFFSSRAERKVLFAQERTPVSWRRRLGQRDARSAPEPGQACSPAEANRLYLARRLAARPHEELLCLFYDVKGAFLGETCASGTPSAVAVERLRLVKAIAALGPRYVILAHNHPGGDARPSRADVEATRALHRLFAALGMILVDHVIMAADEPLFSFLGSGFM